jgi:putative PIG3 family NAD(P)H quinone oxidoreductase
MKAIIVETPGDILQLKMGEVPEPQFGDEELLIKVKAAGVNRADVLQRQGLYPPPAGSSPIIGLEIAGEIQAQGKNCPAWVTGERVFCLLNGGGYAEFAVIHKNMAMKIPKNLTYEEAAAIPEAYFTAYQSIVWQGNLQSGQSILIHAGASGVGSAAIQIAKQIGAKIFTTAGSDQKVRFCLQQGTYRGINYRTESFAEIIREETQGKGVHLIIDFVGSPYWKSNLDSIGTDGHIIVLATMSGSTIPEFDLRQLMRKRLTLSGSTLRNRPQEYKFQLTAAFSDFALPLFATGSMLPAIAKIFSWEDVFSAHQYMEENQNMGKIVLKML